MDAFSYLSVLLSIILGLAITEVLQGYRALMLSRHRVDFGGPSLVWSGLVLLFATQFWWSSFGLRDQAEWSFLGFATVLLQTGLLYMMAALVLPDLEGEKIELHEHFDRQRRPFFAFLLAILATSIVKDLLLDGQLPEATNLVFHGLLAATALAGMVVASRRFQLLLAWVVAAGFISYIALLFARL